MHTIKVIAEVGCRGCKPVEWSLVEWILFFFHNNSWVLDLVTGKNYYYQSIIRNINLKCMNCVYEYNSETFFVTKFKRKVAKAPRKTIPTFFLFSLPKVGIFLPFPGIGFSTSFRKID